MNSPMNSCPCGSGSPSDACCAPYLAGFATPPTAEALMRSRFVAYTRADIDYLEATSGGEAKAEFSRKDATSWAKNATFTKLEIFATEAGQPNDTTGMVDFAATYSEQGKTLVLRERSLFARDPASNAWRYIGRQKGESIRRDPAKVGRNDSCPCGSGQKFKKCHGA